MSSWRGFWHNPKPPTNTIVSTRSEEALFILNRACSLRPRLLLSHTSQAHNPLYCDKYKLSLHHGQTEISDAGLQTQTAKPDGTTHTVAGGDKQLL